MPRKLEAYVEEILNSISEIELFVQGINFDQYVQDAKTKAAVERKLLTIGEALNQANDDALVWDIVQSKLKQLKVDLANFN